MSAARNLSMIALTASALLTPSERVLDPIVLLDGGIIAEIFSRRERPLPNGVRSVDLGDATLAPGFVDLHIHGGAGHDVMENDSHALPAVESLLVRCGVTSYYPTTVTAPLDDTLRALERLADAVEVAKKNQTAERSRPLGIHLEGPFLSHARRGVHPSGELRKPTLELFEKFWQASRGTIRLMTIAPELDGALEVITEAARRNVCVCLGHSDATLEQAQRGIEAGGRHATHTFNAMRPLAHRDPGLVGAALTDSRVTADMIVDGVHLDPAIVRLVLQAKGPDGVVLITDATAATGMPAGTYRLGNMEVEVKDGRCMAGGKLAGSVLTMDQAVRNVMSFGNWDLQAAVRLATFNPARVAAIETQYGTLRPGSAADFAVLGPGGDVRKTIVGGII
jgi:N-acetylglucosamine-6-phosphate deacetylase